MLCHPIDEDLDFVLLLLILAVLQSLRISRPKNVVDDTAKNLYPVKLLGVFVYRSKDGHDVLFRNMVAILIDDVVDVDTRDGIQLLLLVPYCPSEISFGATRERSFNDRDKNVAVHHCENGHDLLEAVVVHLFETPF